jgi:peptidyl-prolyl cis-trans isomerase C
MNVARRGALAAMLLLGASCGGERTTPPPAEQAALGGEVAARVGTDTIPLALVVKVAAAQHIKPREALDRLVDDAICANAARTRGLDREEPAIWLLTAARARATADRIAADAQAAGPATDAEIDELTKQYWREVDRPPAVRVVHVLLNRAQPNKPDAAADARARALMPGLRAAVLDAKDADDFIAKANAFPHEGAVLTAQRLPTFAADGADTEDLGRMDPVFAKGAFTLQKPGDTSEIIESSFGWHVIRLVEVVPEQRMGVEARRVAFRDEVFIERARAMVEARLKTLRAANPVQISPAADTLTRSVGFVKPSSTP